jgi:hypothetical protein
MFSREALMEKIHQARRRRREGRRSRGRKDLGAGLKARSGDLWQAHTKTHWRSYRP